MRLTLKLGVFMLAIALALPISGCVAARNPGLKKMAEVNFLFREAQGNGVMNMAQKVRRLGGNWTMREIEGGLDGEDMDTHVEMHVKAPAGVIAEVVQNFRYSSDDNGWVIQMDNSSIVDSSGQAALIQATHAREMQMIETVGKVAADAAVDSLKQFVNLKSPLPVPLPELPQPADGRLIPPNL